MNQPTDDNTTLYVAFGLVCCCLVLCVIIVIVAVTMSPSGGTPTDTPPPGPPPPPPPGPSDSKLWGVVFSGSDQKNYAQAGTFCSTNNSQLPTVDQIKASNAGWITQLAKYIYTADGEIGVPSDKEYWKTNDTTKPAEATVCYGTVPTALPNVMQ